MKNIIALLLIAVMCLSFVACSNGGENTEAPTSGDKNETTSGTTSDTTNQDDEILQTKYEDAVNALSKYKGGENIPYLYNEFKALGNYKDSTDYLNRFVVLENALTKITQKTVDGFGNENEMPYITYEYNSYGECPSLSEFLDLIGVEAYNGMYTYEYASDGKISCVNVYNGGTQYFKVMLTYNANGNVTEACYKNGTDKIAFTNTYTYDKNQRLVSANKCSVGIVSGWGSYYPLNGVYTYTYDDKGALIKESFEGESSMPPSMPYPFSREIDYQYDSSGFLVEEKITENGKLAEINSYTRDANGKIISMQSTEGYITETFCYYYKTLYIYKGNN